MAHPSRCERPDAGRRRGSGVNRSYALGFGYPMLKPHDPRHGVAMEMLEQQHDLKAVRAMLRHTRIDTTQTYALIKPAHLKRAVEFYEGKALAGVVKHSQKQLRG
jgi:integrase